jgi:hypothetical protein
MHLRNYMKEVFVLIWLHVTSVFPMHVHCIPSAIELGLINQSIYLFQESILGDTTSGYRTLLWTG